MDMRALVDYLNETAYQYYTLGEPTISDAEWDKKYDELRRMEEETGERLPDSPTRRVGARRLGRRAAPLDRSRGRHRHRDRRGRGRRRIRLRVGR